MLNKFNLYDLAYDVTGQDWTFAAGDLAAFSSTHTDILSALLLDALESVFNSMPYVLRNWGFEGRTASYTAVDNIIYQEAYLYLREILDALSFLYIEIKAITPTFPGTNNFSFRIELTLNDITKTNFDRVLSWNGATSRATIV